MVRTDADTRMMQSSRIASIGCFGLVLVLILLLLIGTVAIRADLGRKRANALAVLGRMHEQVDKAPGIFNRMLAYGCGADAEEAVTSATAAAENLARDASLGQLEAAWSEIEDAWSAIQHGCMRQLSEPSFIDLSTELEGARNRFSVEKGNFYRAAEVYDAALESSPASLVSWGFEKL
jgi:hypothetical protein